MVRGDFYCLKIVNVARALERGEKSLKSKSSKAAVPSLGVNIVAREG